MYSKKNITDADLNIIYKARIHERFKLAFLIGVNDALRIGEICNLQKIDLEFEKNLYRLKKQKNGLIGGAAYMSEKSKKALKKFCSEFNEEIKKHENYIVWNQKGTKAHPRALCQQIWELEKRLGIRRIYKIGKDGRTYAENSFHATRKKSTIDLALKIEKKEGKPNLEVLRRHGRWINYTMPAYYANMLQDEFISSMGKYREELES